MDTSKIVRQVQQEYEAGISFKQGRVADWQATEDLYYGKVKKTLKGRFNVPMPVMSGFVDTLQSKIDDSPILKYKPTEEADFRITQKVQSLYDATMAREDYDFSSKDLDTKKLAIFSGRGIYKVYGESDPKFKFCINVVDHYDFYVDPTAGGSLDNARYMGEDNIFKSKSDLIEGANSGYYDKKNVMLLVNGLVENTIKDVDNRYNNKANRLNALGLTHSMYNFMGEGMMRFVESGTIYNGVKYYVLWNPDTMTAIRCVPLKEVFESEMWWWVSWATHRDAFSFWSKAPADDIRPIAETIKILANQELDNRQKRNFGQRAYDPDMFPNGAELEYRPNGLVAVRAGATKVQAISSGIYQFETPELRGTIDLVNWLDSVAGQKSGVTASTQGVATEDKVGIYEGNMQQVADRLGLYNKSYVKAHASIGRRFIWAVKEHLKQPEAVKIIGEHGVEWDKLIGKEVNPLMDVQVESGVSMMQVNEAKKARRSVALATLNSNPNLAPEVNKKWLIEQTLLNGEFTDEEVRTALDKAEDGNREILARASESIQSILEGKMPKLYRGATTGYMQKIMDYATDNTDDDLELYQKLMEYASAHTEIVIENMSRTAMNMVAKQGIGAVNQVVQPNQPQEAPPEGYPEATQGDMGGQNLPQVYKDLATQPERIQPSMNAIGA